MACEHLKYQKEEVNRKWQGHATLMILVKRT